MDSLAQLLEKSFCSDKMGQAEVSRAAQVALEKAADGPGMANQAAEIIERLAMHQGLQCTPADARQAGLVIGSMKVLRAVLGSSPSMPLFGVEIFDCKYPNIKVNEQGRKDGIRCLLARGMTLGIHAPSSKLL